MANWQVNTARNNSRPCRQGCEFNEPTGTDLQKVELIVGGGEGIEIRPELVLVRIGGGEVSHKKVVFSFERHCFGRRTMVSRCCARLRRL